MIGRKQIRWFDVFATAAFVASLIVLLNPVLPGLRSGRIYVSLDGSDWNSGNSPTHAVATIQQAADLAVPGDTIVILPGTYREQIYIRRGGQPDRPITFKAQKPGAVTITNEADSHVERGLKWKDEGDGIFSCQPPWPIYFVRGDGMAFFHCYSLEAMKKYVLRKGAWGTFFFGNGRLYASFPDKKTPAQHHIGIHARIPPPGLWRISQSANVFVEADFIRFEGLRFDFGVGYGVRLWKASDISIVDCAFSGAAIGIAAGAGVKPAKNLRVEYCLNENYPQFEWLGQWMSWAEIYDSYSSSTLVDSSNDGAVIQNNLALEGADGLRVNTGNVPVTKGIDVSGNLIARCTDDAIELDGFSRGIHFHDNLVYDTHSSLSFSPLMGGPVLVEKNLFLDPFEGANGDQIKLMDDGTVNPIIQNVEIRNNTFVGNWISWYDRTPIRNVVVIHNVFAIERQAQPPWPAGVESKENALLPLPATGYPDPGGGFSVLKKVIALGLKNSNSRGDAIPAVDERKFVRPGPRWLDWKSMPATAALSQKLSPDFFKP
ncbi:MAG: chondroitinase-B domain-containing protein [Acidobacteriia bacterium]|nr:chondroitinase-B domain-containing protein [Terriglobia bacterium]